MKRKYKIGAVATVAVMAGVLFSGSLLARWPVLGKEWGEVTFYNTANQPIGGFRVDCDGTTQYWGNQDGRRGGMQLGICHGW